jgi:hypothetical protein
VTHNLAEGVYKNRWDHTRDSVRRTSGFVLTDKPETVSRSRQLENDMNSGGYIYGLASPLSG